MENVVLILSVAGSVVALFLSFHKPLVDFSIALKENSMETSALSKTLKAALDSLDDLRAESKEEHEKIWQHERKQDKILNDHELRIKLIETVRKENENGERD